MVTVAVDAGGADLGPAEVAAGASVAAARGIGVLLFGPAAEIGEVSEGVEVIDAPTTQHFEGVAVVFTFKDKGPLSTLDGRLRGGSDRQLVTSAEKWRAEHAAP